MLARLAALRAKRAAAGGPAARRVDPALAAAAAAAGAPTRGTWDVDYALRLREGAGGGGDAGNESGSDEDVVVLPPPAVKLDPAAQREKWRRDMRTQAKVRRGAEEASGVAFGFERCREEREEEEEEEEVVEVEIQGEIEDEDVMLATVVDPDAGSDAESTAEAEAEADGDACADADAEATGDAGADAEEAEGSKVDNADRQDHAQHQSQSLAPTKCVHADKGRAAAEEEVQAESSPAKAPAATAPRPRLDPLPRKTPLSTRPHFVDDQAEDEDGNARDRDSDRDSDRDGEQTAGDPLSPDDVDEAACDPAAAAFHWQWEEREEATKLAAIVSGAGRGRDARRPRNDDNAMDLTDMVASGAVRAGSVGVDGGDCASIVGDHGGDGNEDGEMLDLAKTSTETYVDNMYVEGPRVACDAPGCTSLPPGNLFGADTPAPSPRSGSVCGRRRVCLGTGKTANTATTLRRRVPQWRRGGPRRRRCGRRGTGAPRRPPLCWTPGTCRAAGSWRTPQTTSGTSTARR
jgi:hypothetical protein